MTRWTWLAVLLCACGRGGPQQPLDLAGRDEARATAGACTDCAGTSWRAEDGFVVHEWGTFTSVAGTDGALVPGLHHEEEDLPGFVADRVAAAGATPGALQKMETPVTYFYAPGPMRVTAKVAFPGGLFTQWFPFVRAFSPPLYYPTSGETPVDPWLEASASVPEWCREKYAGPPKDGLLDWGEVEVLARGEAPALAGPVGEGHYRFARNVQANALRVSGPDGLGWQHERFLFYRGLGSFPLPLAARVEGEAAALFNAHPRAALGGLVLLNVTTAGAGFSVLGELAGGAARRAPLPAAALPLPEFVAALRAELQATLEADGLYADEARAMVDTWERSYFLTPGVRLLYLLPQSEIDRLLPLTISPAPRATRRTMVIRVELLTPEREATARAWLSELTAPATAAEGRASFLAQGRFAEPLLRRALAAADGAAQVAAGEALLAEVQARRRWAPLTAE